MSAPSSHATEPPSRARTALVLGALTAMGPLSIDVYLPSLPTIAREFGASDGAVQISLATYFVGIAVGQALYGPLSDRIGRRPALFLGLGIFVTASAACALSTGVGALILARFLQALGGCAPIVVPRAVVRDRFHERESVRMLSMLMLVMGVAPILGPLIGGQLLVHFGWRAVFWMLTVYGLIGTVVVARFLPESLAPESRTRQTVAEVGATYLALLRDRRYMGDVLTGAFMFAGLLTYITGSPFVFIQLFGVPPDRFGLYFGANAIGVIVASQVNRWLAGRMAPRHILRRVLPVSMVSGLVLGACAFTGFGGFAGILVPLFAFLACYGFVMPSTTALAMAPYGAKAGSASALLGTVQFVIGAGAGALVGQLGVETAVPLAGMIALCGIGACLTHWATAPRESGVAGPA